MSFARPQPVPRTPTLPQGDTVAAYPTYLEAQHAVDYLSDNKFPVQSVTIVGTDLQMVERVTGRLTYGRVAMAGAGSGAWFGLFVGLLLSLFGGAGVVNGVVFVAIALGAGFGLLFSVLSYALTRGKRDFTSQSQIVATTYAILCDPSNAGEARSLLLKSPSGLGKARAEVTSAAPGASQYGAPAPAAPTTPRTPDPRWTTPTGEPRYGAMLPTPEQTTPAQPTGAPAQPTGAPAQPTGAPGQPTGAPGQPTATPAPTHPSSDEGGVTPPAPPTNPYAPPGRED